MMTGEPLAGDHQEPDADDLPASPAPEAPPAGASQIPGM
jgi:hypothetical protein